MLSHQFGHYLLAHSVKRFVKEIISYNTDIQIVCNVNNQVKYYEVTIKTNAQYLRITKE